VLAIGGRFAIISEKKSAVLCGAEAGLSIGFIAWSTIGLMPDFGGTDSAEEL
jgi:hypothetical protein